MTKSSRTQIKTGEMLFLQEAHSVPRTLNISRGHTATVGEIGKHCQNASTKDT